jgi:hypothetical protein
VAPAALLAYTKVALQRGLVCWQAEGNVYDRRLYAYATAVGADGKPLRPDKPQPYAVWEGVWGPADRKAVLDMPLRAALDLEKLPLDRLALPPYPGLKDRPGADFGRLPGRRGSDAESGGYWFRDPGAFKIPAGFHDGSRNPTSRRLRTPPPGPATHPSVR